MAITDCSFRPLEFTQDARAYHTCSKEGTACSEPNVWYRNRILSLATLCARIGRGLLAGLRHDPRDRLREHGVHTADLSMFALRSCGSHPRHFFGGRFGKPLCRRNLER